jgi:hypothetical protein
MLWHVMERSPQAANKGYVSTVTKVHVKGTLSGYPSTD